MSAWSRPACGCSFWLSGTLTATAACFASAGFCEQVAGERPPGPGVHGHRGGRRGRAVGVPEGVAFGECDEQPRDGHPGGTEHAQQQGPAVQRVHHASSRVLPPGSCDPVSMNGPAVSLSDRLAADRTC